MESIKKEYDKLSLDQFKHFVSELKELKNQEKSLQELVKDISKEKMIEIFGDDLIWSSIYELSFIEHLAFLIMEIIRVRVKLGIRLKLVH